MLLCTVLLLLAVELMQAAHISTSNMEMYQNLPYSMETGDAWSHISTPVGKPENLMHAGSPPGSNAVFGLAVYPSFLGGFTKLVGSLRESGYDGHIILGVKPTLPQNEYDFLVKNDVTFYGVHIVTCNASISPTGDASGVSSVKGMIRGKCAKGLETLTLEMGRFELARQWLTACNACTGWNMVMDTRDAFFQRNPFQYFEESHASDHYFRNKEDVNLYFIEEISPFTAPAEMPASRSFVANNFRAAAHVVPCYGKPSFTPYGAQPVLCSGTVLGTREGMFRFLNVLVGEFHANNRKQSLRCRSPHTTDQWTMNWLYYNGKFGEYSKTATIPYGVGPVLTVGKACMTQERKTGATDIVQRQEQTGLIMNPHDGEVASCVHQYDRCGKWIQQFFKTTFLHMHDT